MKVEVGKKYRLVKDFRKVEKPRGYCTPSDMCEHQGKAVTVKYICDVKNERFHIEEDYGYRCYLFSMIECEVKEEMNIEELRKRIAEIEAECAELKKQIDDADFPKENQMYYYCSNYATVETTRYCKDFAPDRCKKETGNCFRTEEEAEVIVEKFKKLLKGE